MLRKKSDGKMCMIYKCEKCNVYVLVLVIMVEYLCFSYKDIEKFFLCLYCR